jgi:hypothetical protein
MDQSSTRRKRTPVGYFGKGRLIGGKGVIFPDSYRRWLMPLPPSLPGVCSRWWSGRI